MRKGFFVKRPDGRRPLGRHRSRWENNIKHILKKWSGNSWATLF